MALSRALIRLASLPMGSRSKTGGLANSVAMTEFRSSSSVVGPGYFWPGSIPLITVLAYRTRAKRANHDFVSGRDFPVHWAYGHRWPSMKAAASLNTGAMSLKGLASANKIPRCPTSG